LDLLACPPSLIVDSGNGLQALWRLEQSTPQWQAIEDINRGAESALGADHCHNIDRLLRVPGTINYPNNKKRAAGRVPVLAASLGAYGEDTYSAEALAKLFPPRRVDKKDGERAAIGPVDLLTADDLTLPDLGMIREAIKNPKGEDRSADGYRCACLMLHAGATPEQVAGVLLNPENAVSGHYLDQANPDRAARRVIERARAEVKMEFPPLEDAPAPSAPAAAASADADPRHSRLFFVKYGDVKPVLNQRYLLKPILMSGGSTLLYAEPGQAKTFFVIDMGFHVSTGLSWRGNKVQRGLVVYVAAEGGELIKNRIVALQKHHPGVEALFALVPCPIDLLRPNGDTQALIDLVRDAERAYGERAVLVVIDTTSRALAGGNENSPDDMGAFVRNVDKIRAATRAATLAVHHAGKDLSKGARGHSLLRAAVDTEIEISDRLVTVTKQRDGKLTEPFRFELVTTIIGQDDEGEFVDSCVVEYPTPGACPSPDSLAAIERGLSEDNAKLLTIVRGFEAEGASLDAITGVAVKTRWTMAQGKSAKDTVRRELRQLERAGLLACTGRRGNARWAAVATLPAEGKETPQ
jgi:hypothetical protein